MQACHWLLFGTGITVAFWKDLGIRQACKDLMKMAVIIGLRCPVQKLSTTTHLNSSYSLQQKLEHTNQKDQLSQENCSTYVQDGCCGFCLERFDAAV